MIGGIYTGAFSPTAAAAVGVAGTGVVTWAKDGLSLGTITQALPSTGQTAVMIFFIILAAGVFNSFLSSAQVPQTLAAYFLGAELSP